MNRLRWWLVSGAGIPWARRIGARVSSTHPTGQRACRRPANFIVGGQRGSIEPTAGGGSAFIAQVTLYSAALGVAISQACYATGENHERAVLKKLLGELDLDGILIQADALHTQKPFFGSSRSRGPTSC